MVEIVSLQKGHKKSPFELRLDSLCQMLEEQMIDLLRDPNEKIDADILIVGDRVSISVSRSSVAHGCLDSCSWREADRSNPSKHPSRAIEGFPLSARAKAAAKKICDRISHNPQVLTGNSHTRIETQKHSITLWIRGGIVQRMDVHSSLRTSYSDTPQP